jgi:hypothetical protein
LKPSDRPKWLLKNQKEKPPHRGKRDSILANAIVATGSDTLEQRWESLYNAMRVAALAAYEGSKLTSLPDGFVQHLMQTFERLLRAPKDEIAMIRLAAPMPPQRMVFSAVLANAPRGEGQERPEITLPVGLSLLEHRRQMIDAFYREAIAKEKSLYEGLGPGARQKTYNQLIVAARAKAARDAGISTADLREAKKRTEILTQLCPWSQQFRIHETLIYPRILKTAGITADELSSAKGKKLDSMNMQMARARSTVENDIRKAVARFESRRYDSGLSQKQLERQPEVRERAASARNKKVRGSPTATP